MSRPSEAPPAPPGLLGAAERAAALGAILLACLLGLLAQLTPLGLAPGSWPAPDLVFCALAWAALARPDAIPAWAVFAIAILRDFAIGGPVGAGALALALTIEGLKLHARLQDQHGLLSDVAAAALGAAAALLPPWALMKLTFAGGPPLSALGPQWLATILAFPFAAMAMRYALRIRRPARVEDRPGGRFR